jgi:uncharacterized protein (DUF697 family)/tellurite resistance protein
MTEEEKRQIAASLLAAACADGHLGPHERQRIVTLLDDLGGEPAFRAAMARPVEPDDLGRALHSPDARRTAYQLAVLVCEADAVLSDQEKAYLERLRNSLQLSDAAAQGLQLEAEHWRDPGLPPTAPPAGGETLERTILQYAILAGAAELLPQTAASIVVIPLQLKLVYDIGRRHGVKEAQDQAKELLAAFGIGATSQVVESLARRMLGGVVKRVGGSGMLGGLLGGAAEAATGTLVSFATTYALGHATRVYYEKGRTLSQADLQRLFQQFQEDAKTLYPKVESEIRLQARELDVETLINKVKGSV